MIHLIKAAISLTGLTPEEDNSPEKYHLILGKVLPVIIGYSESKRKTHSLEQLRYSALVAMLSTICEMMESEKDFLIWVNNEGEWINQHKKEW